MLDTLSGAAKAHASAAQATSRSGIQLRQTEWNLVAAQTFGGNAGAALKGGGGVMDIVVQKNALPFVYVVRGVFGELGVGAGLNYKAVKALPVAEFASSFSFSAAMFLSKASPFYYGPMAQGAALTASDDFEGSEWIYLNASAVSILLGMEVGVLMLMERDFSFDTRYLPPGTDILAALAGCKAFCFYFGTDAGLLPSIGIGERYVKTYRFEVRALPDESPFLY